MPVLTRPDNAELRWEATGSGPAVLVAGFFYTYPETLAGLMDDLSADHTVVSYDLRGTGSSSRVGPYDFDTDVADLTAVLEQAGGVAAAVGLGDGGHRAMRVAAARPDLLGSVVLSGAPAFGAAGHHADALSLSPSVLQALVQMMKTDFRGAMRTIVADHDRVDRTVAHCSEESALPRLQSWIHYDPTEEARALGDRLWILHFSGNMWFPGELAVANREHLPEARLEAVEDGAISRPDQTAAVVRRITAGLV